MKTKHTDHDVKCRICGEEFWCDSGFSCPSKMCDSCGEKLNELQPAARDLIEILLGRVSKLEQRR